MRIQPWTEEALMQREQVFEALTAKALKQTMRRLSAMMREEAFTAAAAPAETVPAVSYTALEGAVMATWTGYVDSELYPFLTSTFVTSATEVAGGVEAATGVAVDTLTNAYAADYLQYAYNRMVGVGEALWQNIRSEIQAGYEAGEGIKEIAERLSQVAGLTTPRALTTARTELISAANAGSYLQMLDAGFDDDEVTKVWLATMDPRTRISHRHAEDQGVRLSDEFSIDIYSGDVKTGTEGLEFPGDPTGTPGNIINCRCSLAFDFSEDEDDIVTAAKQFIEKQHPRDNDGKFKKKGAPDTFRPLGGVDAKTGKALTAGKPTKLRVQLLYNTKFDDGAIMAVRKDSGERIVWDAKNEKIKRQKLVDGKYKTTESLTRGKAYAQWKDEDGWSIPDAATLAPSATPEAGTSGVGKPVKLRVQLIYQTPFEDGDVVALNPTTGERIHWDAKKKRMIVTTADGSTTDYTRGALYKEKKDEDGWHLPASPGPAPVSEPDDEPDTDVSAPAPTPYTAPKSLGGENTNKVINALNDTSVPDGTVLWEGSGFGTTTKITKLDDGIAEVEHSPFTGVVGKSKFFAEDANTEHILKAINKAKQNALDKAKVEVGQDVDDDENVAPEPPQDVLPAQSTSPFQTVTKIGTGAEWQDALDSMKVALNDDKVPNGTVLFKHLNMSITKTNEDVALLKTAMGEKNIYTDDLTPNGFIQNVLAIDKPAAPSAAPVTKKVKGKTVVDSDIAYVDDNFDKAFIGDVLLETDSVTVEKANEDQVSINMKDDLGNFTTVDAAYLTADHVNDFIELNESDAGSGSGTGVPLKFSPDHATNIKNAALSPAVGTFTYIHKDEDVEILKGNGLIAVSSTKLPGIAAQLIKTEDITPESLQAAINKLGIDLTTSPSITEDVADLPPTITMDTTPVGSLPDVADLKATGKTLGTHGGKVFKDSSGQEWLFKPAGYGFSAGVDVDLSTAKLHKLLDLPTPDTGIVTIDGKRGSLQKLIPGTNPWPTSFNPAKVSIDDAIKIQKEHIFDWLVANHDAHAMNLLKTPDGKIVGIDKGQAFKYFGADKLDYKFNPNEHPQAANKLFEAKIKGVPGANVAPLTNPTLAAFLNKISQIPDDQYKAILRPYAVQAAKDGKLGVGGPSSLGLKKPNFPANDVEAFLDAAVARKNNIKADFQKFYGDMGLANATTTGNLSSTSLDSSLSKFNAPSTSPVVNPPTVNAPSQIPGVAPKIKPIKLNTSVLTGQKSTTYADGQVIAEHPVNKERIVWNGKTKKYDIYQQTDNGNWNKIYSYNKSAALANLKDDTGWFTPATPQASNDGSSAGDPTLAPSINGGDATLSSLSVVAKSTVAAAPKFTIEQLQAQADSILGYPTTVQNSAFSYFKSGGEKAVSLNSTGGELFRKLVQTQLVINKAHPDNKVSLLQLLRLLDDRASKGHAGTANKTNEHLFEKKVSEWLASPAGKANAGKVIAEERMTPEEKAELAKAKASQKLKDFYAVSETLSKPTKSGGPFKQPTHAKADALQKKMLAQQPWTESQRKALKFYTSNTGYETMNAYLRSFGEKATQAANSVVEAQKGMRALPEDVLIIRNVDHFFSKTDVPTAAFLDAQKGKIFTELGFASSSITPGGAFKGRRYSLQIEAPAGTPAIFLRGEDSHYGNTSEQELLLAAGLKYEMISATGTGSYGDPIVVRMRVVA